MSEDQTQPQDTDDVAGHDMLSRVAVRKQPTVGLSTGSLGGEDDVEGHGLRTDEIGGRFRAPSAAEPDEDDTEGHLRSL